MQYIRNTSDIADDAKAREFVKAKELQADAAGIVYAAMAGYDPTAIVAPDGTNFFAEWVSQITGQVAFDDPHHPTPKERADFVRSQLAPVVDNLDYFHFGVRLYQLGWYEDALIFLDRFREHFPSREVFSNIGLAHYQVALEILAGCDASLPLRFKLPALLDADSLAESVPTRGGNRGEASACYQNPEFRLRLDEAVRYLEMAVGKDPSYLPAKVNLASAQILAGDYSRAMANADQALKIEEGYLPAMVTRGVALYLYGNTSGIDMADTALGVLKDAAKTESTYGDALYNIAAILQDRKRPAAAREAWLNYLKVADNGPYAAAARKAAGVRDRSETSSTGRTRPFDSPVRLGYLSETTRQQLEALESTDLPTGTVEVTLFRGRGITAYVIDDTVEIVESELASPISLAKFRKKHGKPLRVVAGPAGSTQVYRGFAADVVEGKVVKVVFFEAEG